MNMRACPLCRLQPMKSSSRSGVIWFWSYLNDENASRAAEFITECRRLSWYSGISSVTAMVAVDADDPVSVRTSTTESLQNLHRAMFRRGTGRLRHDLVEPAARQSSLLAREQTLMRRKERRPTDLSADGNRRTSTSFGARWQLVVHRVDRGALMTYTLHFRLAEAMEQYSVGVQHGNHSKDVNSQSVYRSEARPTEDMQSKVRVHGVEAAPRAEARQLYTTTVTQRDCTSIEWLTWRPSHPTEHNCGSSNT